MTNNEREFYCSQVFQAFGRVRKALDDSLRQQVEDDRLSPHEHRLALDNIELFRLMEELALVSVAWLPHFAQMSEYRADSIDQDLQRIAERLQKIISTSAFRWLMADHKRSECCEIIRSHCDRSSVRHAFTCREQFRGCGASTEKCGGPLRTDEEKALSMCGSCLKRYGPALGRDLPDAPDAAGSFRRKTA